MNQDPKNGYKTSIFENRVHESIIKSTLFISKSELTKGSNTILINKVDPKNDKRQYKALKWITLNDDYLKNMKFREGQLSK